jgi:hypothetical protein
LPLFGKIAAEKVAAVPVVPTLPTLAYRPAAKVLIGLGGDAQLVGDVFPGPATLLAVDIQAVEAFVLGNADGVTKNRSTGLLLVDVIGGGNDPDVLLGKIQHRHSDSRGI